MLLGLVLPTSGSIEVLGTDMRKRRHDVLGRMNFESPYVDLPKRLSVKQNLEVYGALYGVPDLQARIARVAEDLDITQILERKAGMLSAGQKTRVGLAKALLNEPEVLLLDEPTASLDPDTADWVRSHFERYRDRFGATVLLASHNMAEVERLCDDVLMMTRGRIVDRGSPRHLIETYGRGTMEEVFLDVARGTGKKRDAAPPPADASKPVGTAGPGAGTAAGGSAASAGPAGGRSDT
jgi:ABC-2 type transport system ATP-binding protein